MAIRAVLVRTALACGLLAAAHPSRALAQHVVTDAEAGKLTLDMLTAAPRPMVRHVLYRPVRAAWGGRHRVAGAVHMMFYRHAVHGAVVRRRRRG